MFPAGQDPIKSLWQYALSMSEATHTGAEYFLRLPLEEFRDVIGNYAELQETRRRR